MKVTKEELSSIARLVDDLCGIVLDESKGYLIENRLASVATEAGCQSFSELYYKARYDNNKVLINKIIDAITTNETLFFRDTSPFDVLRNKAIPDLIDARASSAFSKRIRIWSAACSTGQEPYSIAMTLRELLPNVDSWDITILATDISDNAILQASAGKYAAHEIHRGMTPAMLNKYFTQDGSSWRVKDELRSMVSYKRMNLLEKFVAVGPFDIIMCRNVAIYFSADVRKALFERLVNVLVPDGYLFVGSSESLNDLGYEPQHHCRAVFYQPRRSSTLAPA